MSGSDFWSRRRAGVEAEAEAARKAEKAEARKAEAAPLEDKSDEEILAELDLPDPDTVATGEEIRRFMEAAVPERLRRRALRQLWRSNPVLANLDGLNDYDEDFTTLGTLDGALETSYQVGRGLMRHIEALAGEAAGTEPEEPVPVEPDSAPEPESAQESEPPPITQVSSDLADAADFPPIRAKRMRYSFE